LGYNVEARVNAKILHHEEDFSIWKWLRKKYYYGKTAPNYRIRYKLSARQMSLAYRLSLFLKSKRFYSRPLVAFGVIILKLLECFSTGLGFLVGQDKNDVRYAVVPRKKTG
jgi:hypothetical protein